MKIHHLRDFTNGWIIGDFDPSLLKNKNFEVCIKEYKSGESNPMHHHKIATEHTVVLSGMCYFVNEKDVKFTLKKGNIFTIGPNEKYSFFAVTECMLAVIKTPSVTGDKY